MKITTKIENVLLEIPEELETDFIAWLDDEPQTLLDFNNAKEVSKAFEEYAGDVALPSSYNGEVVSAELYDFLIAYELSDHRGMGGYPHCESIEIPGYEVCAFWWDSEEKYCDVTMLAKVSSND